MKKLFFAAISAAALFLASCAGIPKEVAMTPTGGNPLSFTSKGNTVTVNLVSNKTTGYSWQYKIRKPNVVSCVKEEYKENEQAEAPNPRMMGGAVGVGGTQQYVFEAKAPGTATVIFEHKQPWKKGKSAGARIMLIMVDNDLNVSPAEVQR